MKLLHLFNSLTNRMEIFKPVSDTDVKMSLCLPTVSRPVNLQDARIYICIDIIRRILEGYFSYNLRFAMNIVDINSEYDNEFWELMDKLNVKKADFAPKATDHINEIKKFISDLSYFTFVSGGNVYFNLEKYKTHHSYNLLSSQDSENSSFVLWEKSLHKISFTDLFGTGIPTFHVQCAALSLAVLGSTIDIKAGGLDSCFPHHENEIALIRAQSGKKKIVNYLLHIGELKQENNATLSEILEKHSPQALRLVFIQHHHWHCLMSFNVKELEKAQLTINNLFDILSQIEIHLLTTTDENTRVPENEMDIFCKMKFKLNEAFCESINTSKAFEILMEYINYLKLNLKNLSIPMLRISDAYVKSILILFGLIPRDA